MLSVTVNRSQQHKLASFLQGRKQVEILHGLTDYTVDDTPDSLLQSKLSDILRDSRQFQMLTMYMKDIHGPVNELFFLLHAGDAHERMLCIKVCHVVTILCFHFYSMQYHFLPVYSFIRSCICF